MTNFPSILNRLTDVFAEDRAAFIASPDDYSLLVIDDLGVERSTEYAMEQMFTVIDSRYRSKKPLIVTTNLKLKKSGTRQTLPMHEFITAYWNGVRRFSFLVRISGKKEPGRPKRQRRRLTGLHCAGSFQ